MSIHQLIDILLSDGPLPRKLKDAIFLEQLKTNLAPFIIKHTYRKNQILLSKGNHSNDIYFLEEGIVRGYYHHSGSQKEQTHYLWNGRSIITEPLSFYQRKPSKLTIETLTEVKLHSISYEDLMDCKKIYPVLELFSRNIILQYHSYEKRRNYDLVSLPAWDRYLRLLYTHPGIEQYVSKEIIASFLNITPQTLSRMLKERGHP